MSVHTVSAITEDGSESMDSAMRRLYDPAFKLFGRTIPVSSSCKDAAIGEQEPEHTSVDTSSFQHVEETPDSEDEGSVPDEFGSSSGSNDGGEEDVKVESVGGVLEGTVPDVANFSEVVGSMGSPTTEDEIKEDVNLDQTPKKPDKPVHCPRCKSLDTKFCYFNNYNVNQPRHFCKNCQRYWTAGGTLRNVPVGAGRRKNKHACAHTRSVLSDAVMVRSDPPDIAQHLLSATPATLPAGVNRHMKSGFSSRNLLPLEVRNLAGLESSVSSAVLSFCQESPICGSTGTAPYTQCRVDGLQGYKPDMPQAQAKSNSMLNGSTLAIGLHNRDNNHKDVKPSQEQNVLHIANEIGSTICKPVVRQPVGDRMVEISRPEVPFTTAVKPEVGGASDIPQYADAALASWASCGSFPFMGGPWQYGANLGGWSNAIPPGFSSMGASENPVPTLANGGTDAAGSTLAPAATLGSQPPWAAAMGAWAGGIPWPLMQNPWGPPGWGGAWTMPWATPFTAAAAAAAAPDLTILGKHAREQGEAVVEKVLVPKTLRIDDPGEAARSSIWSTLGIGQRSDALAAGGIFGDFKAKAESRKGDDLNARTRNSNPAGLDRSLSFQENNVVFSAASVEGQEK